MVRSPAKEIGICVGCGEGGVPINEKGLCAHCETIDKITTKKRIVCLIVGIGILCFMFVGIMYPPILWAIRDLIGILAGAVIFILVTLYAFHLISKGLRKKGRTIFEESIANIRELLEDWEGKNKYFGPLS